MQKLQHTLCCNEQGPTVSLPSMFQLGGTKRERESKSPLGIDIFSIDSLGNMLQAHSLDNLK